VALTAGGAVVGQNILTTPRTTYAATPADSCFAFTISTGAITDYYDNEGDNPTNPACTRSIDIPATIGGVAVSSIGQFAFHQNQLTSVTIPSSVTSVGDYAFTSNQLASVTIPNSVTSVGSGAFAYNQLTSVTIPSSVTSIGWGAFGNNQLASVTIPSSVTSIEGYAFSSNSLTSVTIPNSVTSIGQSAFSSNSLTSVTIPNSVTSIESYAFSSNSLTSVTVPSSVMSIGDGAFTGNHITSINFLGAPSSIGGGILAENPIASITHDGTTYLISQPVLPIPTQCFSHTNGTITNYRFMDLELLVSSGIACFSTAVDIPQSLDGATVANIGPSAFSGLQLTAITIPNSVTSVGDYAFTSNQLASVTIPNSVASIGNSAFANNNFASITIPSSMTNIGRNAFYGNKIANLVIPDAVTSIGPYAFEDNQLSSLTLGCGVTSLGQELFAINKLTEVTVPDCITSIDPTAFFGQNPWGGIIDQGTDPAHNWYSSDLSVKQLVYDSIWYVQLHTTDTSNPNHLVDSIINEDGYTSDLNGDGDGDDSLGGHLINPASVSVRYVNGSNASLSTSYASTGHLTDGTNLSDYLVKNVTVPPLVDSQNPTPEEQAALETDLGQYYRSGKNISLSAPTIPGYTLQHPSSPYAASLVSGINVINFTYAAPQTNTGSPTPNKPLGSTSSGSTAQSKPSTQPTATTEENTNSAIPATDIARTKVDFTAPAGSASNPTTGSVPYGLAPFIARSSLAVDNTKPCHQIDSAKLLSATSFAVPDTKYKTLGGLAFVLKCVTTGGDAVITFTLGDVIPDLTKAKIYKQNADGIGTDITSRVSFSNQSISGGTRTTIRYTVQDGQFFDDDGKANSSISDPIYIAVSNDTVEPSATNGTPWLRTALMLGGIVAVLAITTAMVMSKKRRA
jgi:hypothetical protein